MIMAMNILTEHDLVINVHRLLPFFSVHERASWEIKHVFKIDRSFETFT